MALPRANKDLGQHFLKDKNVIESICHDYASEAKTIIEVGPGPGILTPHLKRIGKPLEVYEKDPRFVEQLSPLDIPVHIGDALEVDWNAELRSPHVWLVSNLPYNASVPFLMQFMRCPKIEFMTLMFQREVGDKIAIRKKKNEMSSLMALANTYFDVKVLLHVSPGAFVPPPEVDSIVLSFRRKPTPLIPLNELDALERFGRRLFSARRKQIGSILGQRDKIDRILAPHQANASIRSEALTLEAVLDLYRGRI